MTNLNHYCKMEGLRSKTTITAFVFLIAVLTSWVTMIAIVSNDSSGSYSYQSIRGKTVTIYGKGLYKDMSAEVAPQGIAQDYVTLFIGATLNDIEMHMFTAL